MRRKYFIKVEEKCLDVLLHLLSICHYIVWHYSYFASSGDSRPYNKYYTSVRVEEGDFFSDDSEYIADSRVTKDINRWKFVTQ